MAINDLLEPDADKPVLVIGAAGLDMVGLQKETPRVEGSNPANIRVTFGGVARNVSENLGRLGQPVHFLTAVGRDRIGDQLLAQLGEHNVDVSACLRVEGTPTASYMAVYDAQGGQVMALDDMRVLTEITPAYLRGQKRLFSTASMVFVDANLEPAALKTVFLMARRAHVPVCADTTSYILARRLETHLTSLYLLTANAREVSVINPDTPEVTGRFSAAQAARQLVNRGVKIVAVPLAHFGVCYATSETSGHVPAVRTQVIDPTGAGDALTATLIFGLLNGISLDESVRLGVTASSLILRYPGTVYPGISLERLYDELVI